MKRSAAAWRHVVCSVWKSPVGWKIPPLLPERPVKFTHRTPQTIKRWNVHFPRLKPFFLSFIVPLSPLTGSRGERALLKTSWGCHDSCEHQQPRRPSLIRELPEDSTTSCQEGKWWLSAPCRVPLHTTSGKAPSETPVIVSCSSTGRRTGIRRRSHV